MDGQTTDEQVMDDTGADADTEDSASYSLEDAMAALGDDEDGEQVEEAQAEEPTEEVDTPDAEDEPDDDADFVVTLPDGEEVTAAQLKEWREGNLRQADYTRKTQEVAQEREAFRKERDAFAERATFVETAMQNLSGFVQSLIPPEPPLQLAQTDPGRYTQQLALRQQAMREVQELLSTKQQMDEGKGNFFQAEAQQHRDAENAKLAKAKPSLKDPAKLAAFDQSVRSAAIEFGFSESEIDQTSDARIRQMVYYAAMGKRAEANKFAALRRKGTETPKAGKARPAQVSAKAQSNREAMQRLSRTGSIRDALAIDFD